MTTMVMTRVPPRTGRATFVLVGGVPGAGKSTALVRVAARRPQVRLLDSESVRHDLACRLPRGVPYALYRPLVHGRHLVRVVREVVAGPPREGGARGVVVVHDPATSPLRRWLWARLARRYGWRPVLVMVDAGRAEALSGQSARGRVVRARSFARHWGRWESQRARFVAASGGPAEGWDGVHVVDRGSAVRVLVALLDRWHGGGAGEVPR